MFCLHHQQEIEDSQHLVCNNIKIIWPKSSALQSRTCCYKLSYSPPWGCVLEEKVEEISIFAYSLVTRPVWTWLTIHCNAEYCLFSLGTTFASGANEIKKAATAACTPHLQTADLTLCHFLGEGSHHWKWAWEDSKATAAMRCRTWAR